jgi:hypothetical protein
MNDKMERCEDVDGCMVVGGLCEEDTCTNVQLNDSLEEEEEEECRFPCIRNIEKGVCIPDRCARYDEKSCGGEHNVSRCGLGTLKRCHTLSCPEIDPEFVYFFSNIYIYMLVLYLFF